MQTTVNGGTWAQETWPTGEAYTKARCVQLRRAGFGVRTSPLGPQVTDFGVIRMTLINIKPRPGEDYIDGLPEAVQS